MRGEKRSQKKYTDSPNTSSDKSRQSSLDYIASTFRSPSLSLSGYVYSFVGMFVYICVRGRGKWYKAGGIRAGAKIEQRGGLAVITHHGGECRVWKESVVAVMGE